MNKTAEHLIKKAVQNKFDLNFFIEAVFHFVINIFMYLKNRKTVVKANRIHNNGKGDEKYKKMHAKRTKTNVVVDFEIICVITLIIIDLLL